MRTELLFHPYQRVV
ncbi:hypothetical protein DHT93_00890 [Streptococcus australis]|nr:hypothetical protein [Streptococcus sp. BIOML-A1]RXV55460.1 hypothetical protein DHT93_00890 [Streptococcus australis]RYS61257.1 hypothetical protein EAI95_03860 [Streptococcus sp. bf_0095]